MELSILRTLVPRGNSEVIMEYYQKLLEIYTLEQILEFCELEPIEVIQLLDEQCLLPNDIEVPL